MHGIRESLLRDAVPIDELTPHPDNPNDGDADAIAESLQINGQYRQIVAWRRADGELPHVILAGNTTYAAAMQLGWDQIAVTFVDAQSADEAVRIMLADNRLARLARMNTAQELELLQQLDSLAGTGYVDDDLAAIAATLDELAQTSLDDDDDQIEAGALTHDIHDAEQIVSEAFAHFRAEGYPFPVVPKYVAMQELNALARTHTDKLLGSLMGYHVPDPYQPHRFETRVSGAALTTLEAFADDAKLRHAIKLCLDQTGKVTRNGVRATLAFVRGAQLAAQFRPGFALLMYRRFAPADGTLLDTSTGYGGRLVAFMASELQTYIGIDPDWRTCVGNQRMVDDLCPSTKRVELHQKPAEDVPPRSVSDRCDFAFTSPPYFAKEQYADDDSQSWVRYTTGDAWRDGFLFPLMRLQYAALRAGAYSALNIADVKIRSETYPLERWALDAAQAAGFTYERAERFPIGRVPGAGDRGERSEPVLLFRKPV